MLEKLDLKLMEMQIELEEKYKQLRKFQPHAPITHKTEGQLKMLEQIGIIIEELKG